MRTGKAACEVSLAVVIPDALKIKVEELIIAELKSCIINLNNVESEMGFFHAYHMRAMSIASSLQIGPAAINSAASIKDDVVRSKEMVGTMQNDLRILHAQLQALTSFSYSDPFSIAEQSSDLVSSFGDRITSKAGGLNPVASEAKINSSLFAGTISVETGSKLVSNTNDFSTPLSKSLRSAWSAIKTPIAASNASQIPADSSGVYDTTRNSTFAHEGAYRVSCGGNMVSIPCSFSFTRFNILMFAQLFYVFADPQFAYTRTTKICF